MGRFMLAVAMVVIAGLVCVPDVEATHRGNNNFFFFRGNQQQHHGHHNQNFSRFVFVPQQQFYAPQPFYVAPQQQIIYQPAAFQVPVGWQGYTGGGYSTGYGGAVQGFSGGSGCGALFRGY